MREREVHYPQRFIHDLAAPEADHLPAGMRRRGAGVVVDSMGGRAYLPSRHGFAPVGDILTVDEILADSVTPGLNHPSGDER